MKLYQIERRLKIAFETLRVNDNYLLKYDVNERSITHKLAMYLEQTFAKEYDVDCEYNKNMESESGSKNIMTMESDFNGIENSERVYRVEKSVYPDIIVHKRGSNSRNLLVIEVKKSTSRVDESYDFQKLSCYTESDGENKLGYRYGAFIRFYTGYANYNETEVIYFKKGKRT